MKFKNNYALYIVLVTVMMGCSNKKVSYEQKIEAPLVGSSLAFDLYAYKQDTSIRIATPKGTVIEIEPNTFAHANGSRVSNQIIIKVREMHTANDIFKSGIPMSVDAGRNDFLQSGGMLEIRAFDNNEELVIANGKSINVALAHFKPSNGYSLYHFNEHQNWQVNDTFVVQKNERKRRGLDKIIRILKNPIKRIELQNIYADSDYLFLHLNDYPAFRKVLPSKIFELATFGKPIIAGVSGFAAEFIKNEVSDSFVFEPCNAKQLIDFLKSDIASNTIDRKDFKLKYRRSNINNLMAESILSYT